MMKILGFDIETTGITSDKIKKERGEEHRVIEFAAKLYSYNTETQEHVFLKDIVQRINPERTITSAAQNVHHISLNDLKNAPKWPDVKNGIYKLLNGVDLLVAHNGQGFDKPFLESQPGASKIITPLFDTMLHGRWAHAWGKVPTLGELAFACDVPYDQEQAHGALYDTDVMMQCFFAGLKWGAFCIAV